MKLKDIRSKFYLDEHHAMERFALLFLATIAIMTMIFAGSVFAADRQDSGRLQTVAVYNGNAQFSKSGASITVEDLYVSKDRKRAFLLLHSKDKDSLSMQASKYQAFVTGVDWSTKQLGALQAKIAGGIYVFGTSGYLGVYLIDEAKFPLQVMDLVLRNGAQLRKDDDAGQASAKDFAADSNKRFDQAEFYINPAASEAKHLKLLDGETIPGPEKLYSHMIIGPEEKELRKTLQDRVDDLRVKLNVISEIEDRIRDLGVIVPDRPKYIEGDRVVGQGPKQRFEPGSVNEGGYNFDWQDHSVVNGGFLDAEIRQVAGRLRVEGSRLADDINENVDPNRFFTYQKQVRERVGRKAMGYPAFDWMMDNGDSLASISGSDVGTYNDIQNTCDELPQAWQDYMTAKFEYQNNMLESVLGLELEYRQAGKVTTINDALDAVVVW